MRIRELGPWLRPALIGPWSAVFLYVIVSILLGHHAPLLGEWFENWVVGTIAASLWAIGMSAALLAVDFVRIRRGLLPPTGRHAWLGAFSAVGTAMVCYAIWPPAHHAGIQFALAVGWPIVVSAIGARLATWQIRKQ